MVRRNESRKHTAAWLLAALGLFATTSTNEAIAQTPNYNRYMNTPTGAPNGTYNVNPNTYYGNQTTGAAVNPNTASNPAVAPPYERPQSVSGTPNYPPALTPPLRLTRVHQKLPSQHLRAVVTPRQATTTVLTKAVPSIRAMVSSSTINPVVYSSTAQLRYLILGCQLRLQPSVMVRRILTFQLLFPNIKSPLVPRAASIRKAATTRL